MIKSRFDSGNWSRVNGLPGQDDMIRYLEHLVKSNPERTFTRQELMDSVKQEFGIPDPVATAECPNCETPAFYTRFTYLITDAVQGKRKAIRPFLRRLEENKYQWISDEEISRECEKKHCLALMRQASCLGFSKSDAITAFKVGHPEDIILWAANEMYEPKN